MSWDHCFTSQRGAQVKILVFNIFYLLEEFRGDVTSVNNRNATNYTESVFSPADLYRTDFSPWTILSNLSHWFVLYSYTEVIAVCEYISRIPSIAVWGILKKSFFKICNNSSKSITDWVNIFKINGRYLINVIDFGPYPEGAKTGLTHFIKNLNTWLIFKKCSTSSTFQLFGSLAFLKTSKYII